MKTKVFLFLISFALILSVCKKVLELPEALTTAMANLNTAFQAVDAEMDMAADQMASEDMDTTLIRAVLVNLVNSPTIVDEYSWVTPEGILKIIEPPIYYAYQGADISQQDHIIKVFETKEPVLSLSFLAVEGFYAVSDIHPILNNNTVLGGVDALIKTQDFLAAIMEPILQGQEYELWVMEKDGQMIYNQDLIEVGLNVFTDPYYQDFPEFRTACEKINDEESGTTYYSFYKTGTTMPVTKLTYWTTFEHHGTEWKIVWVKPE